eukprot:TRINITY_DN59671_c0_g1_i1.p1 TRINITY_DN59671_c0_g1~~TRINITY_DN59671_c0_g1_i1.p1  ORF type:complete len:222 (-),score=23.80 TRINITY_DN59671_c0_g1_i1:342-983(-)
MTDSAVELVESRGGSESTLRGRQTLHSADLDRDETRRHSSAVYRDLLIYLREESEQHRKAVNTGHRCKLIIWIAVVLALVVLALAFVADGHWKSVTAGIALFGLALFVASHAFFVQFTSLWVKYMPGAAWTQGDLSEQQRDHCVFTEAPKHASLPLVGESFKFDFRETTKSTRSKCPTGMPSQLSVLTWNIFFGKQANSRGGRDRASHGTSQF